jgi:hypothetical protein
MGTIVNALLDVANGLVPSNGLFAILAAALVFLCLTLSGITGRMIVWVEAALPRS